MLRGSLDEEIEVSGISVSQMKSQSGSTVQHEVVGQRRQFAP